MLARLALFARRVQAGQRALSHLQNLWGCLVHSARPNLAGVCPAWLSAGSPLWRRALLLATLVLGLLVVSPFLLLFAGAWEADPEVVKTVFSSVFGTYVVNTVLLCAGVLLGSLAIGVTSAWLCSQYDFPLRRVFTLLLPLSIVISPYMRGLVFMEYANKWQFALYPFVEAALPRFSAFLTKWWNFPFLVWTLILSLFPYVYVFATALYQKNCRTVIESARLLNGRRRSLFFSVGLPIAAPALRLGAAVVLMDTLNEYGAVSYFGFPSISSAVFRTWFGYQDIGSAKLVATLVLLLVVALLCGFRGKDQQLRYDIGQYYPGHREKLGRSKGLLCGLFCGLWIALGFFVPVLQFVCWSANWAARPGAWSQLAALGLDTLGFVAIAVIVGMAIAVPLSYMFHLQQKGLYKKVFQCMASGYALPSTIVAMAVLGLIYFLVRYLPLIRVPGGLSDASQITAELLISKTLFGLVFAAVLRFFFVVAKPVYQCVHHYGQRCEDSARSLGWRPAKTFWRVALPLNAPFLLGGGLLLVIELLKEIPLTLVLRPFNFDTLAIRAYVMARDEMLYESAAPSLLIIAIGMVCMLAFQRIEEKWKPA